MKKVLWLLMFAATIFISACGRGGDSGTSAGATGGTTTGSAPTVTGISPSSGAAGTTVTITGTNFSTTSANNTVKFNGTPATVTAATTTSLTVTVPTGATNGAVSVRTAGGTATSNGSFTGSPFVTGMSSNAAGTSVTITGINFDTTPANNTVYVNGTKATVSAATATSLTLPLSSGTTITTISVATTGGTATSAGSYTTGSTTAYPKPSFDITSLTFAPQEVGTTSLAQTVKLTNAGNAVLQFHYEYWKDGSADWNITTTCTDAHGAAPAQGGFYVLASGASCNFSVSVTPIFEQSLKTWSLITESLGQPLTQIPPQPIGGYLEVVNVGNGGLFPWGVDTSRAKVVFNGTAVYNLTPACTSPQVLQNGVCVTPPPAAGGTAPTGVAATAGNNRVTISWPAVSGATTYNIYRSTTSGVTKSSTKVASNITGTSYIDTTAVNGITYYYAVAAVNSSGESSLSNEVNAKPISSVVGV